MSGCCAKPQKKEQSKRKQQSMPLAKHVSLPPKQTVLITGTSTGIGELAALDFAARGWNVVATLRNPARASKDLTKLPNVLVLELDVQKQATIDAAVNAAIAKFGKIDVVVNNAGYASLGFFEGTEIEEIRNQLDVNVLGVMRVVQAVLPHFRQNMNGTIVNISSVVGLCTLPLSSTYFTSKWALEGWSECVSYELLPFNIQVKLVEPGAFTTAVFNNVHSAPPPKGVEVWEKMAEQNQKDFAKLIPLMPSPKPIVTDAIYAAATERNVHKMRYPAFVEGDFFASFATLREKEGAAAQYAAVLAKGKESQK